MCMIATREAIEASDTWREIAGLIPTVELYLAPQSSHQDGPRPRPASKPPINLTASDLLREIDDLATFYAQVLMEETHDVTAIPAGTPATIELIASRFGHFTMSDERISLDYCDAAQDIIGKIGALVQTPLPKHFRGPCVTQCGGDLWADEDTGIIACDGCKSMPSPEIVSAQLAAALAKRIMTRTEIRDAFKIIRLNVKADTLHKWVQRGKLRPAATFPEPRYRFADALELAECSPRRRVAA